MQKNVVLFLMFAFLLFSVANTASAVTIANENFEGGASGWSNNTTTVGNSNFTEFLGNYF